MALKDLISQKSALTEEAIEQIVSDYVRYDPDAKEIHVTPAFGQLGNRAKVQVYLVAMLGWAFLLDDPIPVELKPGALEEHLNIQGGTLRPLLKDLKDRHLIVSKDGGYTVRSSALSDVAQELGSARPAVAVKAAGATRRKPVMRPKARGSSKNDPVAHDADTSEKQSAKSSETSRRKRPGGGAKTSFGEWVSSGFFDEPRTLAAVQARFHEEAIIIPRTSIPAYLLAAVRGDRLSRKKVDVNGRQRWVYRTKSKKG